MYTHARLRLQTHTCSAHAYSHNHSCEILLLYLHIAVSRFPPQNVVVITIHPSSLRISWLPPLFSGEITRYTIYYSVVGSGVTMNQIIVSGTAYTLSGLFESTNYSVRVAAANVNGNGPCSNPVVQVSGSSG